uniref:Chloride channel protein n=1 Tax=Panagrolaimus sp. JU765 TaxID=591449 RepID=A0AC34Q3F2_9BILA
MAIAMKFIFTTITAGLKVPAGLFVPNIALGAVIGRTVGLITQDLARQYMIYEGNVPLCTVGKDCVMPGLYAIVGAAAQLCGVMRMTVTLAIIMFELTGSIDFVVPTMAAIMIAKWVGDATYPTGIYDAQIELNGYPFLDNKEEMLVGSTAKELIQNRRERHLSTITKKGMTMGRILEMLNETKYCGFPVIEDEFSKICIGFVDRKDLQAKVNKYKDLDQYTRISFDYDEFSNNINWSKIVDRAPFTSNLQTPVEILGEMFKKLGVRQVLITENGELVDIITKKDLLRFMHHHH